MFVVFTIDQILFLTKKLKVEENSLIFDATQLIFYSCVIRYKFTEHHFFLLIYFIYLFLAALGLRCCVRAFSSCGERGLLFVVVQGLLTAVASLAAEHGLQVRGLQQLWLTGSRLQAQQLWHTGLVAPWHVGSSQTRARTRVPCIGRRILNHCTTREVPRTSFL